MVASLPLSIFPRKRRRRRKSVSAPCNLTAPPLPVSGGGGERKKRKEEGGETVSAVISLLERGGRRIDAWKREESDARETPQIRVHLLILFGKSFLMLIFSGKTLFPDSRSFISIVAHCKQKPFERM